MKVVSFKVSNYRSIEGSNILKFENDVMVLVGKNNEGKSNLLMAINVAMRFLRYYAEYGRISRHLGKSELYDWERDYPIKLQNSHKRTKTSTFRLEFSLTSSEITSFKETIGNNLNGTLPIEITANEDSALSIKVIKEGKGSKSLNEKSNKIAQYIAQRIEFNYIPAVRTESNAMRVIEDQIENALSVLKNDKSYMEEMAKIDAMKQPLYDQLSQNIKETLSDFIPGLTSVDIYIQPRRYYRQYDNISVRIDDGKKTDLSYKGDGIKSLVALALLKNAHYNEGGVSVIAIEEPESHLHPEAIARLRDTIYSLAPNNQVIISTHNPIFVNRNRIKSNIIIDQGKASQAKDIRSIRNVLGVKVSDNLYDAKTILYVEGETDEKALRAVLAKRSKHIEDAIKNNVLAILPLRGAKFLHTQLQFSRLLICSPYVLLDNDKAGNDAISNCLYDGILRNNEYTLLTCEGMKESELEDCLSRTIYSQYLIDEYGVDITERRFDRMDLKWSSRLKDLFESKGKQWNDDIEYSIKNRIAGLVEQSPELAIDSERGKILNTLIEQIEKII